MLPHSVRQHSTVGMIHYAIDDLRFTAVISIKTNKQAQLK